MIPETPGAILEALSARGLRPRKRYGQHFLADPNVRDAIVADAGVGPGDLVLEVGPGLGTLTVGLLRAGAEVLAVEVDRGLFAFLLAELGGEPGFGALHADVLARGDLAPEVREALAGRRAGAGRFLVVSNLPYGVATPLFAALARDEDAPERVVAMVQREVALRMVGRPGGPDYGPLAVLLGLRGRVRLLREVGGRVFVPPAAVRSAVVEFVPAPGPCGDAVAADRLAREAFLHRRKSLRRALLTRGRDPEAVDRALAAAGLTGEERPEVVAPEQFVSMARGMV